MENQEKQIRRFQPGHTVLHLMVIVSFLTLALTGMTLKFSNNALFAGVSHILGGPAVTGILHRLAAAVTFAYAGIHLWQLAELFIKRKITIAGLFKEEYSLVPLPRDGRELVQHLRYFIGRGPKPEFGRWTYWEKFDYWAVFWGITVIGLSGLILWFPEVAARQMPGWTINVAYIIHSEEALLAAGFIFTIHFFNTHFRPGSFPMDTSIFTQRVELSRFKLERPREYEDLVQNGELDDLLVSPVSSRARRTAMLFGAVFLVVGLVMVLAIIQTLLFA